MEVDFLDVQQNPSPIEGIKVHVEGVDKTLAMIVDNDCNASSSICLARAIRLDPVQPGRICCDVIHGCEVYVLATCTVPVQRVKVIECQWILIALDDGEINLWLGVEQLRSNVRWVVAVAGVEPYNRCYLK